VVDEADGEALRGRAGRVVGGRRRGLVDDEAQQGRRATSLLLPASEVVLVPVEDRRQPDGPRRGVDPNVPRLGQEASGLRGQLLLEAVRREGVPREARAAERRAVQGEVDARVGEPRSEDPLLEGMEARRSAPQREPLPQEEAGTLGQQGVPPGGPHVHHAANRVVLEDQAQDDGVVGVQPVGQPVGLAREQRRVAGGAVGGELPEVGPQHEGLPREPGIVHEPLVVDEAA